MTPLMSSHLANVARCDAAACEKSGYDVAIRNPSVSVGAAQVVQMNPSTTARPATSRAATLQLTKARDR